MAVLTISSDHKIKEIHIVFADDGAAVVDVTNNSDPHPGARHPNHVQTPAGEYEIDHADFDSIKEGGLPIPKDERKSVGETLAGVDLDVPIGSFVSPSAITVPDIDDRPVLVDREGMGLEL